MQDLLPEESFETEVRNKRAIIDRRTLLGRIEDIVGADASDNEIRKQVLAALRDALEGGRAEVRRRFDERASGTVVVRSNCYLVDQLIRVVYDHVTTHLFPLANPSTGEVLSLVAVGGYGRGELAPQSDVDLLFLLPYKMTPRSEQVVEAMLYFLWDLNFKVGHATRKVSDCIRQAKADVTICTNLLEARWLWGDQSLYVELRQRFQSELQAQGGARFIEAKLNERDLRHKRNGGTRYSLEPNIKESKGGLRDLHTLFWISKFLYHVDDISRLVDQKVFTRQEVRRFEKAQAFLWTLRCALHYLTGRPEERLTFDVQKSLADWMGYTDHAGTQGVERFMKHYFLIAKDVGDLTRIFCATLEAEHNRRSRFRLPSLSRRRSIGGFRLEGDRLSVKDAGVFTNAPIEMLRIFAVAQKHDLDIHPRALRWITQNLKLIKKALRDDPEANKVFMDILCADEDPATALRRMNEAGVFGRFIPDFGRVVAQMQYNMYHHYTVDEHTIFAIGILHDIEQGRLAEEAPIATEVVHKVLSRRVLYVAVFLHDIAKGRPGDHSEEGAKVARRLCPRLGFSAEETETVAWLVLRHLAMSDTAFKRDIDDPKTIQDFAALVQSPERLRLLLVLTVADIRAVGPNVWNAWKAALLRDLYWRTEEVLSGGISSEGRARRVEHAKEALRAAIADWPKKEIEAHIKRGYPSYWLSADTETHLRHALLVREAEREKLPLKIDAHVDGYREVTEVTIYTADHPGLFSRIAGAMAVSGASIEGANIITLANGMALDTFYVHDAVEGGAFESDERLKRLSANIEKVLSGGMRPIQELASQRSSIPSRYRVFKVAPRVLIDNKASATHTVIEVNGRDRPALLYQLTTAITRLNLMISTARIATYGTHAVDVFYVKDALGSKIENKSKLTRIRKKLLEVLESNDCTPASVSKKATGMKADDKKPAKVTKRKPEAAAE
ncbi:[protein-PII] uridylyltransferase [Pelagibius sp. Alg239-R121]|uniref:[protein-PII] uridylyltransferase n=1 Tax=Pelagibius sp. Alg239-R121 TaxID=2993448 RepID=UPI0024A71EAC|nr:[protein-PII] uridylyltransferase [Pelagibius sp. Alg239-R121]